MQLEETAEREESRFHRGSGGSKGRKGRSRRRPATIGIAAVAGFLLADPSSAQQAYIQWAVAFNGGLIGPLTTVLDNGAGDLVLQPSNVTTQISVTNGVMTLTGTLVGEFFTADIAAPCHAAAQNVRGRRFLFTDATASVAPGQVQNPPGTIELFACYGFDLTPVGPPHIFGSLINGFYGNIAGNDIDLAHVEYASEDNVCSFTRPGFTQSMPPAFQVPPTVPFCDFQGTGVASSPTVRIGTYHRFLCQNDGDAIFLPGSSIAFAANPIIAQTPLPPYVLVLVMAGIAAGAWMILRRGAR
jgi:hypothetical protein